MKLCELADIAAELVGVLDCGLKFSDSLGKGDGEAFNKKEAGGGWWEGVGGQLGECTVDVCSLVLNELDMELASDFAKFCAVNFEGVVGFFLGKGEGCNLAVEVGEKFIEVVGQVDWSGMFGTNGGFGRAVPFVCGSGIAVPNHPLLVLWSVKVSPSGN